MSDEVTFVDEIPGSQSSSAANSLVGASPQQGVPLTPSSSSPAPSTTPSPSGVSPSPRGKLLRRVKT